MKHPGRPLPPVPAGKSGWPWVDISGDVPLLRADGSPWPKLVVVTPSFNQGEFIEETLRSVLAQGYPELEYVVIDGGSTDRTREVLERYSPWITRWQSQPDGGQYDAVNVGFAGATADLMAWINSDDVYAPGAFATVGEVFSCFQAVDWVTSLQPMALNARGRRTWCRRLGGFAREGFRRGEYVVGAGRFSSAWIPQESTFWRRSLWERAGGRVDAKLQMAGDFELWSRFYESSELFGVDAPLAGFRRHRQQKTSRNLPLYRAEAADVFARHGGAADGFGRALARKWLSRLPAQLRRPMPALGLGYRAEVITKSRGGDRWILQTRPV